ncbi:MAG: hypothetical protein LBB26_01470 [Puniceicoccales bacterium]|jgi:hypothetical protein|nr:hypothetical protein [Puniceicoccales bacterium]
MCAGPSPWEREDPWESPPLSQWDDPAKDEFIASILEDVSGRENDVDVEQIVDATDSMCCGLKFWRTCQKKNPALAAKIRDSEYIGARRIIEAEQIAEGIRAPDSDKYKSFMQKFIQSSFQFEILLDVEESNPGRASEIVKELPSDDQNLKFFAIFLESGRKIYHAHLAHLVPPRSLVNDSITRDEMDPTTYSIFRRYQILSISDAALKLQNFPPAKVAYAISCSLIYGPGWAARILLLTAPTFARKVLAEPQNLSYAFMNLLRLSDAIKGRNYARWEELFPCMPNEIRRLYARAPDLAHVCLLNMQPSDMMAFLKQNRDVASGLLSTVMQARRRYTPDRHLSRKYIKIFWQLLADIPGPILEEFVQAPAPNFEHGDFFPYIVKHAGASDDDLVRFFTRNCNDPYAEALLEQLPPEQAARIRQRMGKS